VVQVWNGVLGALLQQLLEHALCQDIQLHLLQASGGACSWASMGWLYEKRTQHVHP
jgi:hypothetical protein